jgi:hypothetical protein
MSAVEDAVNELLRIPLVLLAAADGPALRRVARRFSAALAGASFTAGGVTISLAEPERPESRLKTGHVVSLRPPKDPS